MSKLYVAYGSNLNLKQMAYRCPTATLVEMCIRDREKYAKQNSKTVKVESGKTVTVSFANVLKKWNLTVTRCV